MKIRRVDNSVQRRVEIPVPTLLATLSFDTVDGDDVADDDVAVADVAASADDAATAGVGACIVSLSIVNFVLNSFLNALCCVLCR